MPNRVVPNWTEALSLHCQKAAAISQKVKNNFLLHTESSDTVFFFFCKYVYVAVSNLFAAACVWIMTKYDS